MNLEELISDPIIVVLLVASLISWWIIVDRIIVFLTVSFRDHAFYHGGKAPAAPLAKLREDYVHLADAVNQNTLLLSLDSAIEIQRSRLERPLPLLGAIASASPYVGLLGTVIGIIRAFMQIQAKSNMNPETVGSGISQALVATASGLAVAIPAVIAHHLLSAYVNRRTAIWEAVITRWLGESAHATEEQPEKPEKPEKPGEIVRDLNDHVDAPPQREAPAAGADSPQKETSDESLPVA